MHLVPAERADHRIIDADRVCDAIAVLADGAGVRTWSERFALLGDPTRLALLVCIHRVGPISVSDLAVATGLKDTAVSQALRLLRNAGAVAAGREGRVVRYRLLDAALGPLLDQVAPAVATTHRHG
ncbi:metalloregulator ArsR/SmtB family transcription factor [Nocardioides sp. BP30]|uniref:ArsR/SmtB family transcription factor n=1 Tax=Nocardioides sp. BP30 TaxID=3036374 RepID=UPI0024690F6C|nr:metalloregulator ArsR/SmtB family transcription factor [Nocardioides sp. BP30]WGL51269.1 metalloregulator ArsR/SmtB family transcription factor [Nocardioides sp. BP30]